ncbi:E3 ubiquitin-protein ligase RING1-like [Telopea speciosissima]|uniref:E3 ubiquitin-protein ligase RING1-like n=1 Tax=Telopea speciosissima TaxID=54955 RepID=UPI001CC75F9A|nr:E3 ubiquitin-protein ligase RING1-like [Telopea speciosissima]
MATINNSSSSSSSSKPKALIHFIVEARHVLVVTTNDGSEIIVVGQRTSLLPEKRQAAACHNNPSLDIFIDLDVPVVGEYRRVTEAEGDGFTLVPVSRASIEALEIKKFDDTAPSSSSSIETCMICLDKFKNGVDITPLPGSHSFHTQCIINWLEHKNLCPLCRHEMPTEEPN